VVAFTWLSERAPAGLVEPVAVDAIVRRRHRLADPALCGRRGRLRHTASDGRARSRCIEC
jgi:hypothetical protein